jgi:hypothetical protein
MRRWGALLSSAVLAFSALLAAPGILFAPVLPLQVVAAMTVLLDIAGLVLVFHSAARRTYWPGPPAKPSSDTAVPTR